MFNYSSPSVKKFSLASTCQYPPQIGRLAPIWHMVQSSAASPSLFSWPASTPEEHGNTHRSAHSQKTHARSQNTHTLTHTHTHTQWWCNLSVSFVCEIPLHTHTRTYTHWVAGHSSTNSLQQVSRFSTMALYMLQQPSQPQPTNHNTGILKSARLGVEEIFFCVFEQPVSSLSTPLVALNSYTGVFFVCSGSLDLVFVVKLSGGAKLAFKNLWEQKQLTGLSCYTYVWFFALYFLYLCFSDILLCVFFPSLVSLC